MILFLTILIVSVLVLGTIAFVTEQGDTGEHDNKNAPLTLLPGDIKYESKDGKFHFYFPIMTSLVLSVVLTLVLRFFG